MSELFGTNSVLDLLELRHLLSRLALDLVLATFVIRLIHYRRYRDRELVFTYFSLNVITFCLCLLLGRAQTQLGLALALFGVFGILRYRTEQIRIRDLTYLFIVIGLGVLNGVANKGVSLAELLVIDGVIVAMTALLELGFSRNSEHSTQMLYDQLELLRPGNEAKLMADLRAKTGLTIQRIEVNRFDLLRDAAEITVFSGHPS